MGFCTLVVRFYLVIGAIINAVIGVACFLVAGNIRNFNSDYLVVSDYKDAQNIISIIFYSFGSLLLVSTLSAMGGFLFKIKFLQQAFAALNIIFFLIFLSIFFFTVYSENYVNKEFSDENCTTGPLKVTNEVFDTAKQYWCKNVDVQGQPIGCPCNIEDKSQWPAEDQVILSTYNGISSSGTSSIDTCTVFQQELAGNQDQIQFLKLIEETFECTGVCQGDIIYYFSDINRGPTDTKYGCYNQIRDFIYDWLEICYVYSIIAFSIELTNTIFSKHFFFNYFLLNISFIKKALANCWIIKKNTKNQTQNKKIYIKDIEV